jgi:hypothetical protein
MTESEYYDSEISDADIDRLADAGERFLNVGELQNDFLKALRALNKTCTSVVLDKAVAAGNAYLAANRTLS